MVIRDNARSRGLVLVVEDNEGMRQAIDQLLDLAGFSGIAYSSAEALMAERRVEDAICVICDIRLAPGSGFDLLTQSRARGATPVILISAKDTVAIRNKAKRFGAAAYLAKPFPGNELIAAIERTVKSAKINV
jgi:FixJ family two-component response regulator